MTPRSWRALVYAKRVVPLLLGIGAGKIAELLNAGLWLSLLAFGLTYLLFGIVISEAVRRSRKK